MYIVFVPFQQAINKTLENWSHGMRVPYTFFVKRDWGYVFLVKRDLGFFIDS